MKLIPMTDFVLEQKSELQFKELGKVCIKYAHFLKQPLKSEMFVPIDDNGNVLEEPKGTDLNSSFFEMQVDYNLEQKYQQAKEKVLFEDFEIAKNTKGEILILGDYTCLKTNDLENKTIEDLTKYAHIKLTESAIKIIFG